MRSSTRDESKCGVTVFRRLQQRGFFVPLFSSFLCRKGQKKFVTINLSFSQFQSCVIRFPLHHYYSAILFRYSQIWRIFIRPPCFMLSGLSSPKRGNAPNLPMCIISKILMILKPLRQIDPLLWIHFVA